MTRRAIGRASGTATEEAAVATAHKPEATELERQARKAA
jgi:hypothetical protein